MAVELKLNIPYLEFLFCQGNRRNLNPSITQKRLRLNISFGMQLQVDKYSSLDNFNYIAVRYSGRTGENTESGIAEI